jgi:signal transduction histidine kinase
MTAARRAGTVALMRSSHGSTGGPWRSSAAAADLCPAVALLLAAELEVLLNGLGAGSSLLAAFATLPLALRRRLPVASFACVAILTPTLDRALGSPWGSDANALVFVVLAAAYSLGAHAPLRSALPAVLAAAVWLAALEAIWGDGEDFAFLGLLLGVPWLSGRGVRRYRRQTARLRELTLRLERERAVSERVAVERERQRMAHETHDTISHAVGEMVVQAAGAEQVLARDPQRARGALAAVQTTGRDAVDQLRAVLGILRSGEPPPAPPAGEIDAVETPPGRSWPPLLDVWLALVLLALGAAYVVDASALAGHRASGLLAQALAAGAVALRGKRALGSLALAAVAYAGECLLAGAGPGSPATIAALLLTTYSAAALARARRGAIGAACIALGTPAAIALGLAGADAADVVLPVVIFAIPWLSGRAVAAYRRRGDELRDLARRLARERDARARLAVLDERTRIARELHDSIAHAISVMVLQAGAAEQVLDSDPAQARAALRAIQRVGREALDQLGTLLGLLEPAGNRAPLAPRPGLAELERLLDTVRRAGLPVRLTTLGEAVPLPAALDATAFRVIQEALTNALRHSGGAPTQVTIRYASDGMHLDIVDIGAAPPRRPPDGHGLAGMRERIAHHGGRLEAGPGPAGAGFAVSAFLPYAAVPAADPVPA